MSPEPSDSATRERSRVALVTCAALPGIDADDQPLADALVAHGVAVDAAVWDDPAIDWADYDLVVLRSPWDYQGRRDDFVAWAAKVPRLANPADIVAWNTDKIYLRELAAAGIAVVPTAWVPPGRRGRPRPRASTWSSPRSAPAAATPAGTTSPTPPSAPPPSCTRPGCMAAGRTVMIQPYLTAVDTAGETAVLCTPDAEGRLTLQPRHPQGTDARRPDTGAEGLSSTRTSRRVPRRRPSWRRPSGCWPPCRAVPTACSTPGST